MKNWSPAMADIDWSKLPALDCLRSMHPDIDTELSQLIADVRREAFQLCREMYETPPSDDYDFEEWLRSSEPSNVIADVIEENKQLRLDVEEQSRNFNEVDLANRKLLERIEDVRREEVRVTKLNENVEAFCKEIESIVRRRDVRRCSGQRVTGETNPLFYVQPSALRRLRTWAQQFRSDLEGEEKSDDQ